MNLDTFKDAVVMGVPLVVFVLAFVQWLKSKMELAGKVVEITSVLVGLLFGLGYQFSLGMQPTFAWWFGSVVYGLALGLFASGGYDLIVEVMKKAQE